MFRLTLTHTVILSQVSKTDVLQHHRDLHKLITDFRKIFMALEITFTAGMFLVAAALLSVSGSCVTSMISWKGPSRSWGWTPIVW